MAHHRIYGGCLETEIAISALPISGPCRADWKVRRSEHLDPLLDPVLLGEERLVDAVSARLVRGEDRFRLSFDDTGAFDVSLDGREIAWMPLAGADPDLAQIDLLGRVLSLAVHASGDVCLHASAVVVDGSAIAFLGPKGFGKSALAMALVSTGATLLTDDTLRLRLGPRTTATPGPHSIRLWNDVADHLGRRSAMVPEPDGGKLVGRSLPDNEVSHESVPLAALYLLHPVRPSPDVATGRRTLLPSVEATLGVIQHAKIALLLGKSEGAVLLHRAASLTSTTPVFRLEVPRDLAQLPVTAQHITGWHKMVAPPTTTHAASGR
jgi:hypothetical protein